jgi:hypothetical protein
VRSACLHEGAVRLLDDGRAATVAVAGAAAVARGGEGLGICTGDSLARGAHHGLGHDAKELVAHHVVQDLHL